MCCPKSPEDPRDWIFESLATSHDHDYLPESYSLEGLFGNIRDQGSRGTCAAFVGAGIKSIQYAKRTGKFVDFSPEFIYYHRENKPSSGMYGRNVFQVMQKFGNVKELKYPYGEKTKPTEELYNNANKYRISSYARIISKEGLRRALFEIGPCYVLLPLYKQRPTFWKSNDNKICDKSHSVLVIGYNETGFVIANSWGSDWNGDGTIVIPYLDWKKDWEVWVCMDSDNNEQIEEIKSKKPKNKRRKIIDADRADPDIEKSRWGALSDSGYMADSESGYSLNLSESPKSSKEPHIRPKKSRKCIIL